ncbi:MAG TPA: valine--tRNA ligase [Verrucomicrobiae bacterium]|jgi:valyl-tRNA synthetase|nr:valine--tRNA ligase [Verrucomicrobiae bacterium]
MAEVPKAYEPQSVEAKWYNFWLEKKLFVAKADSTKPAYSIVIPPPNVTGILHMGHVLNNTIQDILARKARMEGKEVLWLPGTDHAGIATQVMVEKKIRKEEHKTRHDIGREEFLKRIWEWKEKHGGIIIDQLKKLGASCDWTRERFTMDPEYSRCVQRVFVELYKKGLIYRGKRMVNWCPATQTALSDEEVIMKQQNGSLYYFKVEVAEQPGTFLSIATTRPETIPADTAVAVNPKDPRYAHLIGKHVLRPLPPELPREQKLIPIIGDEHVDFEFGTGVLKVTPAHDKADFEIGERHNLPVVDVLNPDGTMNDLAGNDLKGLDRFKARKLAGEKLAELGALDKEEPYSNNVGFSERADVPIEPRLSEQWFLKYPSVPASTEVVTSGRMKFFPDRWAKVYEYWMSDIHDWCISRQLWWGHRVPVWRKQVTFAEFETLLPKQLFDAIKNANTTAGDKFPEKGELTTFLVPHTPVVLNLTGSGRDDNHVTALNYEPLGESLFNLQVATTSDAEARHFESKGFVQDTDVLDTWFSSWLWPFATMGWPESTPTLKKFYPTTDLVTGPDIIFFWVARMIMAGYEFMSDMPFRNVYFTGIIRDKQGRKMSKQLGNSPDPLDLINKYGADALRFGVMRSAPLGQDVLFDEKDVELGRNFCNKLWNACRFRQMQGGVVQGEIDPKLLTSDDKWILLKLGAAIQEVTDSLAEYKFNEATQTLYRFFWSEYCDWYVEASKAVLHGTDATTKANTLAVIDFVLSHTLRMFHPFLPFITEELWHGMGYNEDMPETQGGQSVMYAPWPKTFDAQFREHYGLDNQSLEFVDAKYELITLGRNLRRENNISSSKKARFILKPALDLSPNDVAVLQILLNAEPLDVDPNYEPKKGTPTAHSDLGDLYLPLEGVVDLEAEKARLRKKLEGINAEIAKVQQKLSNPAFTQKVPPAVLKDHQQRLADWQAEKQRVESALRALEG